MSQPLPVINGTNTQAEDDLTHPPYLERATPTPVPVSHDDAVRMQPGAALPRHDAVPRYDNVIYHSDGVSPDAPPPTPGGQAAPARRKDLAWVKRQFGHAAWTVGALRRWGRPQEFFHHLGGIGDQVLMTAVFRELVKRGHPPVTMLTAYPQLFQNNPDVGRLLPEDPRYIELARRFGVYGRYPCYTYENILELDCLFNPPYPIIARMCKVSDVEGPVDLRPYLHLTEDEKREGKVARRQVAIMSSGLGALFKQRNKQWYPERYQAVVDALRGEFDFVQLGRPEDPLLEGALDLRGKTTLRQSAAVLSQSLVFVGQIGLLMHMTRAVDCRSVIVYGGRETPYQSGYGANENLYTPVPCSPCWKSNACEYDRECLQRITAEMVVEATRRQAGRWGEPLPVDRYNIMVDRGQTPPETFARGVLPDTAS